MNDPVNAPAGSPWDRSRLMAFAAQELQARPDEFSPDENLIELGLGSVSLMRLRSLLQRDGYELAFSALAQAGSVDAWLGLLDGTARGEVPAAGNLADPAEAGPFPLTHVQRAYWLGRSDRIELGGVAAHGYLELATGELDPVRLEAALNAVIAAHPMLRAVITEGGEQVVLDETGPYRIAVTDLAGESPAAAEAALGTTREALQQQILPFDRWPMFDIRASHLPDGSWRLHVSFDILLFDIKSLEIWVSQWWRAYDDPAFRPERPAATFREHVARIEARNGTPPAGQAREYWERRLPELPLGPDLPLARRPTEILNARFARVQTRLGPEERARIGEIARSHGLTESAFLMALYARALAVWSAAPRFCLTVTLFSRDSAGPDMAGVIGDFTSLLPLEIRCDEAPDMAGLARQTQERLWQDLDHGAMSGIEVLARLNTREGTHGRALLPYVFTSGLGTGGSYLDAFGCFGRIVDAAVQTPQLLIDHQALDCDGGLVFNWDHVAEAFEPGQVAEIADLHLRWLRALTVAERWHDPALFAEVPEAGETRAVGPSLAPGETMRTLYAPFRERAASQPEHCAVISGDRQISYAQLDAASDRLAETLIGMGAVRDEPIAIVMPSGWQQIVAALAVLKSGAAYLPVDPALPEARIRALLEMGGARLALVADTLSLPGDLRAVRVGGDLLEAEPVAGRPDLGRPDALAYLLFTSGSTGTPKGVMIEHSAALTTLTGVNDRNGIGPGDRCLAISSLSFDLSVYDVFGTLAAGGTLVIPEGDGPDPALWQKLIETHDVTLWNSVPALLGLYVEHLESQGALSELRRLRHVFLSGDWLPVPLCGKLLRAAPDCNLVSMGGPTEGAIWQVDHPVREVDPDWRSIPYGRPLPGHAVHILDHDLAPRPTGVAGEIYVGGEGLARGYWRDPDRTAASFVIHPRSGERLYRSGDWARWTANGWIEFLGRDDSQIKLNGLRLELGEVETTLAQHPALAAAAAVPMKDVARGDWLAAFVTAEGSAPPESMLYDWLAERLPRAFVPARIHVVPALPLSGNGKVDRAALRMLARSEQETAAPRIRNSTDTEARVLTIWSELLEAESTNPEANFFALGGSSLLATRLAAKLSEIAVNPVSAIRIFEFPTAAQQATLLDEPPAEKAVDDGPEIAARRRAMMSSARRRRAGGA